MVQQAGYLSLAISCDHGLKAGSLDHAHKDPFDRMLVAQAMVENLMLLSAYHALDAFDLRRVW